MNEIKSLINSMTQEQYDRLGEEVQANVDRDDMLSDVQQALAGAGADKKVIDVKDDNHTIWLFVVKDEAEILAILNKIMAA